jgi:hypothetical protein
MAISRHDPVTLESTEQHIQDPVSGLTVQFDVLPDGSQKLTMFGDFPLGNREFIFSPEGLEAGARVALADHPSSTRSRTASD